MKNKKLFRYFRIVLYSIAFLYLLIKEPNAQYSFIICPSKSLFNIDCYFCGMTRAFICMFHLKINDSISYNPLVLVFYPLIILLAVQDIYIIIKNKIMKKETNSLVEFFINKI